jgi:hypothetical protein
MNISFEDIAPFLGVTGQSLVDLDENKEGADDFIGALLIYVADVGTAIKAGSDLPPLPDVIANGTKDKISGVLKGTLRAINPIIMYASFRVPGKAAIVLRYVNQAISLLIAGQPVPAAPAAIR